MELENGRLEFKAEIKMDAEDEDKGVFVGYGSYFGNKDQGNDVVQSGAFAKSIAKRGPKGIKMLYNHKQDEPIGVYKEINEDNKGLRVKGMLALGTQRGKEVYELMKMGAIDGLSIGYKVDQKGYDYEDNGKKRILKEVDLMEISAVTFPMNQRAKVRYVKGLTIRDWERELRDVFDLSQREAKITAQAVVKALNQRDVEEESPEELLQAINTLTKKIKE
tara:strand:- start:778 stop:1437 length:660 start_codon:yes stop_codon:yes gene_type:complete